MAAGSSGKKRDQSPDVDTVESESLLLRLSKWWKVDDGAERGWKTWRTKVPQPDDDSKKSGFV